MYYESETFSDLLDLAIIFQMIRKSLGTLFSTKNSLRNVGSKM